MVRWYQSNPKRCTRWWEFPRTASVLRYSSWCPGNSGMPEMLGKMLAKRVSTGFLLLSKSISYTSSSHHLLRHLTLGSARSRMSSLVPSTMKAFAQDDKVSLSNRVCLIRYRRRWRPSKTSLCLPSSQTISSSKCHTQLKSVLTYSHSILRLLIMLRILQTGNTPLSCPHPTP